MKMFQGMFGRTAFGRIMTAALAALTLSAMASGQQLPGKGAPAPAAPAAAAPAGGPSAEEIAEVQKLAGAQIQNVADLDARIKGVDAFVQKFPTSVLKGYVLSMAGEANQMKGDRNKALFYYEEALKADPKDYNSMLMIAAETAQATTKFDLKKEEKLGRAEKLANDAMALIAEAVKPNPQVPDAQWEALKKDDTARGHEAIGMIEMTRENFPAAVTAFQKAIDASASPQLTAHIRMGGALNDSGKFDEAIAALNKVLAVPGLPDAYKGVAENEKKRSEQLKAAKK